ncbi:coiled-coil-helix-coiled-coil-helix domain-containing protein 2-like [Watersipora subatra]|uniref:coiled-coil-helix-coiled-coil-helix domain-containing protein 2-like n=1 Tax=Watersipora subatra TaxID=2589382 RepID=UPI00355C21F1
MPRRSSGGGMRSVPARAPAAQPPAHPPAAQPRQPGLFGQMAATAGGVAIGSAVGHAVGHTLVSGGSSVQGEQPPPVNQQQQINPCAQQLEDFLQCAKTSSGDLNMCYGFNEALRQCKANYGA